MDNIEKHPLRKGEYIGYAKGPWRIVQLDSAQGRWLATYCHDPRIYVYTHTLSRMSRRLKETESQIIL